MNLQFIAAIGLASALLPAAVCAQTSEYERVQMVYARQALMFELQDRYWVLRDVSTSKSTDFEGAAAAAEQMIDIMTEFVGLLATETARGEVPGSRAMPEVWTDAAGFAASVESFRTEAAQLAEVARSGDAVVFSEAFDRFSSACTSCHEFRPTLGGRFRFTADQ
jgi:cytochrome c556